MLLLTGMAGTVLAQNGVNNEVEISSSPKPSVSLRPSVRPVEVENKTEAPHSSGSPEPALSHRLSKPKLDICAKKTKHVNQVMDRITERATAQLAVFTKISDRTQAFYAAKGNTVVGYDALVAATTAAKQKSVTDIAALKAEGAFTCDSADPKGSVEAFKTKTRLVVADLKAYKTAVKNLIVAVKSVQPAQETK
jgi:hypothetical protein